MSEPKIQNWLKMSSRATRFVLVGATGVNAVFVLSVQVIGLVTLTPVEFGFFSVQYLLFALASSICLSVVCESWLRSDLHDNHRSSWRDYSSALLYLSFLAGTATTVVSVCIVELRPVVVPGTVAVIAATYRTGARYYQVRSNQWSYIVRADTAGLAVTVGTWVGLYAAGERGLIGLSIAWAAGTLASSVLTPRPGLQGVRSVPTWISTHRRQIAPLLRDSSLMDLGAIGTPFAIAPLMGIGSFGIYRAVSNVAAPVRLVLNPLRPTLSGTPLTVLRSRKRVLMSVLASAAMGLGAFAALRLIGAADIHLGSLSAVVTYAVPTALFVTANFLGHYYYIIARAHIGGGPMLIGRLIQTVLAIALPLIGVLAWGLPGAIWAYAIATCASSLTWFTLIVRRGVSA